MRKLFFILFLWLATQIVYAQQPSTDRKYTDSLITIFISQTSDSTKAKAGYKLTDFYTDIDSAKAVFYLHKSRALSQSNPLLYARSYWYEAAIYQDRNYPLAEKLLIKADLLLQKFDTKSVSKLRTMIWHNYALIQQRKDDTRALVDILIYRVLPLAKKTDDKVFLGTEYISIGGIFTSFGQYDKALPYLKLGVKALVDVKPENYYLLINAYLNLSENYLFAKKYESSWQNLELAKATLNKCTDVKIKYGIKPFWLDYYRTSTRLLSSTNQFSKAIIEADKSLLLAKELEDEFSIQSIKLDKYAILYKQKKYNEAKSLLNSIANESKINSLVSKRLEITQAKSEINFATGNYKEAYIWLQKSKFLNDSLNESKLKTDINALEIKYQNAENQKKISNLNNEKKQNELVIQNNKRITLLLIAAAFFLIIIVILLIFYLRNYKKLAEQRAINYHQSVADLQQKQQLEISRAMLNAEEKERNRVARDLHDGLGGMLSGLKINLSSWARNLSIDFQEAEFEKIVKQLDGSVTELRLIARNMMPQTLLKFGLEVALKDLTESAMSNTIHIDFQPLNISGNIALEEQIIIYRIVQEMLTNTLKHAQATEVVLQCSENEQHFYITIEDNGVGFDTSKYKKGLGLENIKNRVAYLKGIFDLESSSSGTTIDIEIPISYE